MDVPEVNDGIKLSDVDFRYTKSSGAGGQHVNKVESAVIATHIPTGTQVRCENERSQHKNKAMAIDLLSARVNQQQTAKADKGRNKTRKEQVGSGMRGDKVRTIRTQDNQVKCEITGQTKQFSAYEKGDIWF